MVPQSVERIPMEASGSGTHQNVADDEADDNEYDEIDLLNIATATSDSKAALSTIYANGIYGANVQEFILFVAEIL